MYERTLEGGAEFLNGARGADGAWPYSPGNPGAGEPTCYAALATQASDVARSVEWLRRRIGRGGHAQWEKSLALLTFERLKADAAIRQQTAQELLEAQPRQAIENRAVNELDAKLRGWSWVDNTFSWVEPTSYALLALKAHGAGDHPRVQEAERLLLDRVCADGGWNYGNRKVRGEELESMMPTTALAVLALQRVPAAGQAVARALNVLEGGIEQHPSSLSLALAILCFDVFDRPADKFAEALAARQQSDGSWRRQVHLTALAMLALQTHAGAENVFKV